MSLVAQTLVTTVRHILTGRTWAENRVLEQPIDPIASVLNSGGKPCLAVYAEQTHSEPESLETQRGPHKATLTIMVYCPPSVKIVADELVIEFDGNAGLALNLIGRQAHAALHHGNTEWVALLRRLVVGQKVGSIKSRYLLIEVENAVRVPALEMALEMHVVPEPEFGTPLYGAWLDFDGLLRGISDEGAQLADLIKATIEAPAGLPDYAQFQVATNVSDAALMAIGLAPLAVDDNDAAVTLEDVDAPPDITITPPGKVTP